MLFNGKSLFLVFATKNHHILSQLLEIMRHIVFACSNFKEKKTKTEGFRIVSYKTTRIFLQFGTKSTEFTD